MGRWRGGVRVRTTLAAALVAAVALVGAAFLLLSVLESNLLAGLDSTVRSEATNRVALLDAGAAPDEIVATRAEESVVWIGTPAGEEIAGSGAYRLNPSELPDLTVGGPRTEQIVLIETGDHDGEQEREDVRYTVAASADGVLVLVGAELETIQRTTSELSRLLAIGVPVLSLAIAGITWQVTGRTLAPVERMRTAAASIGDGPLDRRVPEPSGNDEVQRLAVTFNHMLDRIDRQQRAQRRFTADASHELKSPVANLRVLAETAAIDDPAWAPTRDQLVDEADRLAAIVNDLLFLAVADERTTEQWAQTVHVDDLLFDDGELIASTTDLRIDLTGVTPCDVTGDHEQLRRLVRNLVDNACRHAATRVALGCSLDGDEALITVEDDGPGVPEQQRAAIFERFARTDDARDRPSGGTGLGLAIVRTIAASHGGAVEVTDAEGGGARFAVRLPQMGPLGPMAHPST